MKHVFKILLVLVVGFVASTGFAQKKKLAKKPKATVAVVPAPDDRVDTTRISNLAPGLDVRFIQAYANGASIDTMMWGGEEGASILRFDGTFMGKRGRYVIGLQGRLIDQVAFNMIPMNKEEALDEFDRAKQALLKSLGTPVEEYANVLRMYTWRGKKQELKLQTKDDVAYFTVVLTYAPPPKSQPKTGPKNWWEK